MTTNEHTEGSKMTVSNAQKRVAKLEQMLKQAKMKAQQIDAKKKADESKAARALDTRRKILIGAAIQSKVASGTWTNDYLNSILNEALTRANDRALFNLEPLKEGIENGAVEAVVEGHDGYYQPDHF